MKTKERDAESLESLSQVLPNTSNPAHMIEMAMANSGSSAAAQAGQDQLDRSKWLLDCPEPPSPWHELKSQVRDSLRTRAKRFKSLRKQPLPKRILSILQAVFPIFGWCRNYKLTMFKNDLMAGLTLASLCIPQVHIHIHKSKNILTSRNLKFLFSFSFLCRALATQLLQSLILNMAYASLYYILILRVFFPSK